MFLAINAGSSSIKCKLYNTELQLLGAVHFKNYAVGQYIAELKTSNDFFTEAIDTEIFSQPFQYILQKFTQMGILKPQESILWSVHRMVHGGEKFVQPTEITDEVYAKLADFNPFAPLHNPIALEKVIQARKAFNTTQYAVFDTAFHASIPQETYLYGLPYGYYENLRVRRYGFHGISYAYILNELKTQNSELKTIIACHLGSGSSVCAIKDGKSINHSFGFTPNENLIMATRSGEVDYDAVSYIKEKLALTDKDVSTLLNSESGLLGISGYTKDMKRLLQDYSSSPRAKLAVDMYVQKIVDYIASFYVELEGCDALVFTGGIGAGSDIIRHMVVDKLKVLHILLDHKKNSGQIDVSSLLDITAKTSHTKILVIPVDEELQMVREVKMVK